MLVSGCYNHVKHYNSPGPRLVDAVADGSGTIKPMTGQSHIGVALLWLVLPGDLVLGQTRGDQTAKGIRVYASIKNPDGTATANARVTLKTAPGNAVVTAVKSNNEGTFQLFIAAPGSYVVTIEAPGYLSKRYGITAPFSEMEIHLGAVRMDVDVPCSSTPSPSEPSQPIRTTLCELLKDPDRFNGKMVRVRAKVYFGFEASLLRDGTHEIWLSAGFLVTMFRPWGSAPEGSPVVLRKDAEYRKMTAYLSKLHTLKNGSACPLCPLYAVTVDATGRFDHVDKIATPPEQRRYVGFGHMNGYESQLVLESVSNVVASPIDPSIYERMR